MFSRRRFLAATAAASLGARTLTAAQPRSIGFGFSLYGMKSLPLNEALTTCAANGYSGVELAAMPDWPCDPLKLNSADRRNLRGKLTDLALDLPAVMENLPILATGKAAQDNLDRLKRAAESERRLRDAMEILAETKDYPADRIEFDSPVYAVLQATADHHAETGDERRALQEHEELLQKVMAAKPEADQDLRDAYSLSLLYASLSRLQQATGAPDKAAQSEALRIALWNDWNRRLPNNPFVRRQLKSPPATARNDSR